MQGQIWAEVDLPRRHAEKAGPAENVMVKEVWGTNALVEWQPPKDDGNSEVTGYFVQKADKKTMVRGRGGGPGLGVPRVHFRLGATGRGLRGFWGPRVCAVSKVLAVYPSDSGLSLWHLIWSPRHLQHPLPSTPGCVSRSPPSNICCCY